mmetsp:Transcript_13245/g.24327  ORF Transcript_13245/g.24327 Transcript_13245/m.24327 type:complete len:251 (-) Transcript_13245:1885-2637(-)
MLRDVRGQVNRAEDGVGGELIHEGAEGCEELLGLDVNAGQPVGVGGSHAAEYFLATVRLGEAGELASRVGDEGPHLGVVLGSERLEGRAEGGVGGVNEVALELAHALVQRLEAHLVRGLHRLVHLPVPEGDELAHHLAVIRGGEAGHDLLDGGPLGLPEGLRGQQLRVGEGGDLRRQLGVDQAQLAVFYFEALGSLVHPLDARLDLLDVTPPDLVLLVLRGDDFLEGEKGGKEERALRGDDLVGKGVVKV